MRRTTRAVVVALAASLVSTTVAMSQSSSDAWNGTWKLNVAKSRWVNAPPLKSQIVTLEQLANGQSKQTADDVDAQGQAIHHETTFAFNDLTDYPDKGAAIPNTTGGFTRINDHRFQSVTKVDDHVTVTNDVSVSRDGKTLTVTSTGINPDGQPVSVTLVYDKQVRSAN